MRKSTTLLGAAAVAGIIALIACVSDAPSTDTGDGGGSGGDAQAGGDSGGGDACTPTCGSACIDLQADKKNCGACGHDCLGGDCNGGKCQPLAIFTGSGTNPVLAGVVGIALDGSNVFWTAPHPAHPGAAPGTPSVTYFCASAGPCATPTTYFTENDEVDSMQAFAPGVLLLADNSLGGIQRLGTIGVDAGGGTLCPGGNPCVYSTSVLGASNFAFDTDALFIGSNGDGMHGSGLYVEPLDGGAPRLLDNGFSGAAVTAVAADPANQYVYAAVYGTDVEAFRMDQPNSAAKAKCASQTTVGHMLVTQGQLFWTRPDTGDVLKAAACLGANCGTGVITPSTFASTLGSDSIMSDATKVYWSAGADLYDCAITGCAGAPQKFGTGPAHISAITNDSQAVYWGDDTGSIYKLAK